MKIREKLDELRNNILRDTSDIIAGDSDRLWNDETLLRYIKNGERRFARQVLCIRDSTTVQVTQFKLKTGVQNYPLDPSVIAVLSMRYDTDNFDIQRSGHAILMQAIPPDFLSFDPSVAYNTPPGRPIAYFTDETLVYATAGRVTASIYPLPGVDQDGKIMNMRVLRLPLSTYTIEKMEEEDSEIPEDYELDPLQWAAYLATSNHDGDAGSPPQEQNKHEAAFEKAVANATRETKRKLFANMNFRFGMGGFAWTR